MRIQNRFLDFAYQPQTGMLELKLGWGRQSHWLLRIVLRSPITDTSSLMPVAVYKSQFRARHTVHPGGGGSTRLVCEQCGADYPYVVNPCACMFCAVPKESGFMLCLNHRTLTWMWSDWGWALRSKDGRWVVGEPDEKKVYRPVRFRSWRKAATVMETFEWQSVQEVREIEPIWPATTDAMVRAVGFGIEVVLYPVKDAVAMEGVGGFDKMIRIGNGGGNNG